MSKFVCKICLALKGLKGSELDTCPYVFDNDKDFYKHLEKEHKIKVKKK